MRLRDFIPFLQREAEPPKALTFTPQMLGTMFPFGARFPGSNIDYAAEVRNGMYSSVITAAVSWMMRTFPEAPVCVQRSIQDRWEKAPDQALAQLIRNPNPEYGGIVLWQCTIADFCFGEAYWLKVRNGRGDVVELWWIPRTMITPYPDPLTGMLSHYVYQPGFGASQRIAPNDVVHFRFGKDMTGNNMLRGSQLLGAVMREVYIDDQAANFTAAILRNLGIIGVLFSPKDGTIPEEEAKKLRDYIQANFTGDKRGQAMLFTKGMDSELLQYNLQGFDVGPIRDIVEERVCSTLGIPAAVIGFGTGLQQTKVGATMRENVKLAWTGGIEPIQRALADEMDRSLLPEFHQNTALFRTWFDTSQVEALSETPAECADRVIKLVTANIITVAQGQRELGYPVDASQDKYIRELTAPPPAPTPPPPTDPAPPAEDPTPQYQEAA